MNTKEDENEYISYFRDEFPFRNSCIHLILVESIVYRVVLNVSKVFLLVDRHRHIQTLQYNHKNE